METTFQTAKTALHVGKRQDPKRLIRKHPLWRALEIVPGAILYAVILGPPLLSFIVPDWIAIFMIVYTTMWLFRSIKLSVNLYRAYRISKRALKTNWNKMISLNDHPEKIDYELKRINKEKDPRKYFEILNLKSQVQKLQHIGQWKKSKNMYHAIICVTYKESYELLRESLKSYAFSKYPADKIIMVLAGEENDEKNFVPIAKKLEKEFGHHFKKFMYTVHPKDIPGECRGKSANATFAAKELKKYVDKLGIKYDDLMISNFDADTVAHPNYFSELTYKYLTTEDRSLKAYQPNSLFHNNLWDVPLMMRVVAQACSYWRLAESVEPKKYKSFSSRSLSFQTLVEVDYWDVTIIPEDSRQYWTAYTIYNGQHEVVPIFTPVYMDAVLSETYVKTFQNQYKQLQRWAWGVSDFSFISLNIWYNPNLSLWTRIYKIADFLKNSLSWATGPILITFMGFVPALINPTFRETVLAYNLPHIMSDMLTLASVGMIVCGVINIAIVPYNPRKGLFGQIMLFFQWIFIPIVSICLSAIPAIDAQTRLMFGNYLEYRVTEKARK
ncbi:glycosyltransferase family 2 protein [Candidatus Peregrinibacteria bacterium]|nr:glycosyltransferase family 2 protein [Candidatus Peregrinibacteria bacterium]